MALDSGDRPALDRWGTAGRWLFLNWPRGSWQYDLICAAIIAALFLLPGPAAAAQVEEPLELDAVLGAMERAGEEVEAFRADFTSTKRYAMFDEREVESGTIEYLEPGHFKRRVEEPHRRIEVVGSGVAQVFVPRINQVQRYRLGDGAGGGAPRLALPGLAAPDELRRAYDVSLLGVADGGELAGSGADGGREMSRYYRLELIPTGGTEAAKHWRRIELWIPEGRWLPAHRIVLEEHTGDETTLELREVDRSPDLEADDFELDLPGDVEVVEHGA